MITFVARPRGKLLRVRAGAEEARSTRSLHLHPGARSPGQTCGKANQLAGDGDQVDAVSTTMRAARLPRPSPGNGP